MVFRTFSAPFLNSLQPGATRSAALHACPWLSYCAPLALSGFHIPRLWRCHISYSAPGAQFRLFCKANGNRIEHDSDVVNLFCRQLRSPRIVCSFARNDSEFRKCPENSPDVSLHRSDEQNFSEFVDRVRQLEKAFCITFEV